MNWVGEGIYIEERSADRNLIRQGVSHKQRNYYAHPSILIPVLRGSSKASGSVNQQSTTLINVDSKSVLKRVLLGGVKRVLPARHRVLSNPNNLGNYN